MDGSLTLQHGMVAEDMGKPYLSSRDSSGQKQENQERSPGFQLVVQHRIQSFRSLRAQFLVVRFRDETEGHKDATAPADWAHMRSIHRDLLLFMEFDSSQTS
jgi:hypothetical protein